MNQVVKKGHGPLHIAVIKCHTELALSLIDLGASVNQVDRDGNSPLHLASKEGHTELALSLIKHGASVNQVDQNRNSPLHLALEEGHTELALSLIKLGASVNQENEFGSLPVVCYITKLLTALFGLVNSLHCSHLRAVWIFLKQPATYLSKCQNAL